MLMFDFPAPVVEGIEAYDRTWDFFFAGHVDLRLTVGLRRIADEWVIVHEHHSVPTTEARFRP